MPTDDNTDHKPVDEWPPEMLDAMRATTAANQALVDERRKAIDVRVNAINWVLSYAQITGQLEGNSTCVRDFTGLMLKAEQILMFLLDDRVNDAVQE